MSSEQTQRDAELRRMLVATADAAPSRAPRRAFMPMLVAFVSAGALTGGAVSAAALGMPSPASTVNVKELASGLVYEDTQLFGTPFILTGEGETNVILGSPPEGATDILIAFNCLDAASYDLRIDGEQTMTITCDEESTVKAGGGSFFPIDAADLTHTLTIATGSQARYALWASWTAPAEAPEPSAARSDALADGMVTETEYRAGFARYQRCMTDAGHPLGSVDESGTIITYVNSSEAVQSGVEGRCYAAEFGGLDGGWQSANQ